MYAKLIDGALIYAPKNYKTKEGQLIINFNTDEEILKEYGYKLVIDVKPDYDESIQFIQPINYIEDENTITIEYAIMFLDPTLEDRVTLLENEISTMINIISEEANK